ncbi:YqhA family protein [Falsiroseomonas sp. CW058]|uniref:YqhA family protein n=1 Tax=Falsiroseomonas sp. CW058 TaxID=3388664 RepID=UPI003D3243AB
MQTILNKAILASRYILVVFLLGLVAALAVYALSFLKKLWKFALSLNEAEETRLLIDLLHLLDSALVASLVVMVAISSYDSLVARLDAEEEGSRLSWVAAIDPGNLKIKLASALIAISSIQLLQLFMEIDRYDDRTVTWAMALHGVFLAGALVLGALDRMTAGDKKGKL